ncbi:hypothetical protein LEMLEM_LOCUS7789 [Lemmus lemmus]
MSTAVKFQCSSFKKTHETYCACVLSGGGGPSTCVLQCPASEAHGRWKRKKPFGGNPSHHQIYKGISK